jgi:hypothetical protein
MPTWLAIWIARFASGERLRPAASGDYRFWFGVLFLFPIWLEVFVLFGGKFLNGSAIIVWLNVTIAAVAGLFFVALWSRFVPAKVSIVLAAFSWSMFLWTSWHQP